MLGVKISAKMPFKIQFSSKSVDDLNHIILGDESGSFLLTTLSLPCFYAFLSITNLKWQFFLPQILRNVTELKRPNH